MAEYDSVLLSAALCPPAAQNHLAKWNKRVGEWSNRTYHMFCCGFKGIIDNTLPLSELRAKLKLPLSDSLLSTPTSLPGHGIAATASSASSTSSAHFEPSNSAKSAFLPPRHEKQLQVRFINLAQYLFGFLKPCIQSTRINCSKEQAKDEREGFQKGSFCGKVLFAV